MNNDRTSWGIACLAAAALALHGLLLWLGPASPAPWGIAWPRVPLHLALLLGGVPLVRELLVKLSKREFGSDLLAGISIVASVLLGEELAGTVVVLMLSGGEALEAYAVRRAGAVLAALARRMPTLAHRKRPGGALEDVPVEEVAVGELVVCFPHEICPVDGTVVEGRGSMDESFLTGEPYVIPKTVGTSCLSGAINGTAALTLRADRRAEDSRYAQIMSVMRDSEQRRPRMRRLAEMLGAWYTPLAVGIALAAWYAAGDPRRFLAVLVIATPCPLLIAVPVAILGAISLAARRGIIIRDPAVLERIETCRTAIFDKTGTLTYGKPEITEIVAAEPGTENVLLARIAALERYSKHPLAQAVTDEAARRELPLPEVQDVRELPGEGLSGRVDGRQVRLLSRRQRLALGGPAAEASLPEQKPGLECVVTEDGAFAALIRFRDRPRPESKAFLSHLPRKHRFERVLLVSGDREAEVKYLAELVGITEIEAERSPEQKLDIVRDAMKQGTVLFVGDGINDAPALTAATVGVAFGQNSDITSDAAGAVVVDRSLGKVDELLHIGGRLRRIALECVLGGMALSLGGMGLAAFGLLDPVQGAVFQEIIDVLAVLNAMRVGVPPGSLRDF